MGFQKSPSFSLPGLGPGFLVGFNSKSMNLPKMIGSVPGTGGCNSISGKMPESKPFGDHHHRFLRGTA